MDNIISVEFTYRSRMYYALVRTKEDGDKRLHSVTIMNGDLERLLYGHHVIVEKDGCFQSALPILNRQISELKETIIYALCRHVESRSCQEHGF